MNEDEDDIKKLVAAQTERTLKTKRSRSFLIAPHLDQIKKMIELNISLPLINGWLQDKHKVVVTLQTLRTFVVRTLGKNNYDDYCKRNGWAKTAVLKNENQRRRADDAKHGAVAGLSEYINQREEKGEQPASKPAGGFQPKISNPADVRKASRREINLEDYVNKE